VDRYFYNADWLGPLSVKNVVPLEIAQVVKAADLRFLPSPQYSARARGRCAMPFKSILRGGLRHVKQACG
jgi:hypothetical protein